MIVSRPITSTPLSRHFRLPVSLGMKPSGLMPAYIALFSMPLIGMTGSSPINMRPCFTDPTNTFIAGVPRNFATNRFFGSSYTFCGLSICCIFPLFITTIRSEMLIASSWSCVTNIVVMPVSRCMRRISSRVWRRSLASRFDSGSSSSSTLGRLTRALAIATRCC